MPRLIATSGANSGTEYPLAGPAVLGRHEECGIVVSDRRASRKHAQLSVLDGRYYIEDLGSRNGTFVNEQPITRQALKDGDEISICDARFLFREDGRRQVPAGGGFAPSRSMVTFTPDAESSSANVNAVVDADGAMSAAGGDEALQRSQKSLRTIYGVANALVTIHDLQELLEEVMNQLFHIFPQADRGFVMLKEEGTSELQAKVIRSRKQKPGETVEIKISSTVVNEVISKRKAMLTSDAMSDERFSEQLSIVNFQIRSMISAPLLVKGEILGLIHIDTMSSIQAFTQADLELLAAIAPQVAIAIRNAQLIMQVEMEAERRSGLQRYLSPDLVELIMNNELDLNVGGRSCVGTAFFSDIIGFTRMSENLTPAEVVDRLNRYLHVMEEIIFRNGGTVDKFGGDSIMAFWGVLVERAGAVLEAVTAAVEMQVALFSFNFALGGESLAMGIGLNTGEMVAGNMGSDQKVEFTVIGDTVNTAQRIESKAGRGQVFISEATYSEVRDSVAAVKLPAVEVKNKSGPVQMYSIRAIRNPRRPRGVVATMPATLDGFDALLVWADVVPGRALVEVTTAACPKAGSEVELALRLQEKPDLSSARGRVVSARQAQGPRSCLIELKSPPADVLRLLTPGNVLPTSITADQVLRV